MKKTLDRFAGACTMGVETLMNDLIIIYIKTYLNHLHTLRKMNLLTNHSAGSILGTMRIIKIIVILLILNGCTVIPYVGGALSVARSEVIISDIEERLTDLEEQDIWK